MTKCFKYVALLCCGVSEFMEEQQRKASKPESSRLTLSLYLLTASLTTWIEWDVAQGPSD